MYIKEEYKRMLNLIVLFVIMAVLSFTIKIYFKPFFVALILMISATPIYNILKRINIESHIASFISIVIVNFMFFSIIIYFGNYIILMIQDMIEMNQEIVSIVLEGLSRLLKGDIQNIISSFNNFFGSSFIKSGAVMTGESIVGYFVANMFTFFMLIDKGKFGKLLSKLIPEDVLRNIGDKGETLKGMVSVQIKLIVISVVIMSIGFAALRVDRPIFLAVFSAIIDILPYVGTIIVFIPIIIYNIIMENYFLAIGFVILYILLVIIRQILETKLLSNKLELHPLIVFLAIYIGINIFGLLGIIIGPIYCMLAKDIIYNT